MIIGQKFVGLTLLTAVISTTGCASILSKSKYPVAIESSPSGANFVIKNRKGEQVADGVTPATVTLPAKRGYFRSNDYEVQFEKDGYASASVPLKSSLDEWYFGNILLGGAIGMLIVDPATGAMWELPKQVTGSLATTTAPSTGIQQASHVEPVSQDPPDFQ